MPYDFDRLGNGNSTYDAGPDGRLLMVKTEGETDGDAPPPEIRIVLNWVEELKARVPLR